ncbi:LexA family protein [Gluconobacter kondonii]|uniref:LexA family protein n=1 Tax=Gluconobacter kondonii TaxID=941463 RepID=UPI0019821D3C|nr:S24 family peptidase [Gluconobacter kondonii]MBN3866477.1 S24 family peptidase [Gluconobacter kondonii]
MNYQGDRTTGFASPAGDNIEGTIDLMAAALDLRQPSRYPVRVEGDALLGRSIRHGDILVVDSAAAPRAGVVVVASVGDELRVCELTQRAGEWWLRSSSPQASPVQVDDDTDVAIWAVATGLVRTDV